MFFKCMLVVSQLSYTTNNLYLCKIYHVEINAERDQCLQRPHMKVFCAPLISSHFGDELNHYQNIVECFMML